jgi:hypothetical protein
MFLAVIVALLVIVVAVCGFFLYLAPSPKDRFD